MNLSTVSALLWAVQGLGLAVLLLSFLMKGRKAPVSRSNILCCGLSLTLLAELGRDLKGGRGLWEVGLLVLLLTAMAASEFYAAQRSSSTYLSFDKKEAAS